MRMFPINIYVYSNYSFSGQMSELSMWQNQTTFIMSSSDITSVTHIFQLKTDVNHLFLIKNPY